ncbi:serine hydrolase domain-containing protein [Halobacteriovorax sp. RT-2-4]|uniref:serine hydrolase domain-containing protein n=2 Tax=unclassified Halobacteriovorax TaxID=2639665 RepID=UPI00399C3BDC
MILDRYSVCITISIEVFIKVILFVTFIFCLSCQFGQESNINTEKLDKFFAVLENKKVVSGSAILVKDGKSIYNKNYNFDKNNKNPIYRIGSVSKIYTATIILKLEEEGKLKLSDKLSLYYPKIDKADKITIEDLLRHRTGIPNMTDLADYKEYSQTPQSESQMMERFYRYQLEFMPGEKYEYSNTGYVILSYIAQKAGNDTYANLLTSYIVNPLSLQETFVYDAKSRRSNEVTSYFKRANWEEATNTHQNVPLGAGAIASTPLEVATFLRGLFREKIINSSSLKKMKEFIGEGEYGLGLMKFPYADKYFFGHTGGVDGYASIAAYNIEDDIAMVNLTNALSFNFNDMSLALLAGFYGDDFDIPVIQESILVKKEILDQYNGTYGSNDFPIKLTFRNEDGVLLGEASSDAQNEIPFEAFSNTIFKFQRAHIKLEFKDNGEILIFTQGEEFTLKKLN